MPLFRGKIIRESAVETRSVRCSEFRGGRFSEVANVLHKRDFQSVIATLSAVGSVSASRSVRSGRFYCIQIIQFESYCLTSFQCNKYIKFCLGHRPNSCSICIPRICLYNCVRKSLLHHNAFGTLSQGPMLRCINTCICFLLQPTSLNNCKTFCSQ